MSDPVFAPKITHRIAGVYIDKGTSKMTPWQRLREWEQADKGRIESTNAYITAKLKAQWPGNYRVERVGSRHVGWPVRHAIVFDDPAEETMFRLKWAK